MEQSGTRPEASWVMGRSARWHTSEGAAMLAEDGAAEELRRDASELGAISTYTLNGPAGPVVGLWLIDLLIRTAWRTFRRERD